MPTLLDLPDAFTAAECDMIVALGRGGPLEPATVYNGERDHVDPRQREAERCYWSRDIAGGWIHARLDTLFAAAAERFELAVDPLFEDVQFLRYGPGAHFQSWHSDAGVDRLDQRRISLSVELSEPGDYEGGVL
ncbi:MAG TPA: hypothetical protein VI168_06650, partial [Croceibacterium sp.]